MRTFETVNVPATTRQHCIKRTCDLCGMEAKPDDWTDGSGYTINETEIEVTVRHKDGSSYPDGGSGTETVIDLCPICFKQKLIPWLQSQGAKIESKEWEW